MADLYDTDIYSWALKQADALRRRSHNEIDWDHVAEEIESVGRSEVRELRSRYVVLLSHLLKWQVQSEQRSASWEISIRLQRRQIAEHLEETPSLKSRRDEIFARAYFEATAQAALQTGLPLSAFPDTNPYTHAQALDDAFWPEG